MLLISAMAFYASYVLGAEHFWWSYTLLVIAGSFMHASTVPWAVSKSGRRRSTRW